MKKIYISPSDQRENRYAVGDTNEAVQCRAIARALVEALRRCGFEARTNEADGSQAIYQRLAQSNLWPADLHLCIHTNAFDGKIMGTRLFSYDLSGPGYQACQAILAALAPITPGQSDSIQTARFTEILQTGAPCAYLEVGFHDNETEAQWIIDHTVEIAEAICQGVCRFYGAPYQPGGVWLRVGPFTDEKTAQAVLEALKTAALE